MTGNLEEDLERAMLLVRSFRLHAVAQNLDPKAVRVAILFLKLVDDHFAAQKLKALAEETIKKSKE